MFYAILPASPAVFLVQTDSAELIEANRISLLAELSRHFMSPVALVWWDTAGRFKMAGYPCTEAQASDDALAWREFSLPVKAEEPPF